MMRIYDPVEAVGTRASQSTDFSTPDYRSGDQYAVQSIGARSDKVDEYNTGAGVVRPLGSDRKEGRERASTQVDHGLVERAISLIKEVDLTDPVESTVILPAIANVLRDLWRSAAQSSPEHRQILAVAEAAVLSWDQVDKRKCSALLEAMSDLSSPVVTESHVEVIRSRFIDEGWNPLALVSDIGDGTDD